MQARRAPSGTSGSHARKTACLRLTLSHHTSGIENEGLQKCLGGFFFFFFAVYARLFSHLVLSELLFIIDILEHVVQLLE